MQVYAFKLVRVKVIELPCQKTLALHCATHHDCFVWGNVVLQSRVEVW